MSGIIYISNKSQTPLHIIIIAIHSIRMFIFELWFFLNFLNFLNSFLTNLFIIFVLYKYYIHIIFQKQKNAKNRRENFNNKKTIQFCHKFWFLSYTIVKGFSIFYLGEWSFLSISNISNHKKCQLTSRASFFLVSKKKKTE